MWAMDLTQVNQTSDREQGYCSDKLKAFLQSKLDPNQEFHIPERSLAFVQNQLATLDLTKATGLDGLSAKYLRLSSEVITPRYKNLEYEHQNRKISRHIQKSESHPMLQKRW